MEKEKGLVRLIEKIKSFIKSQYKQLVGINDTPHRKAMGLAIGVFLGVFPGLGPAAAVLLAWIFRANKAAAFLGGLVTNTWMSFVTLALAIQVGSGIVGKNHEELKKSWRDIVKDFHWDKIFNPSLWKVVFPILVGFVVVSFCIAVVVYILSYFILSFWDKKREDNKS